VESCGSEELELLLLHGDGARLAMCERSVTEQLGQA
jgi:hypothetical protein